MVLGDFVAYCQGQEIRCLLGEIGWNAIGKAAYETLDAGGLDVAYWAAGEAWGTDYNLSLYTGAPQARRTSVASVVEQHGSQVRSDRQATLGQGHHDRWPLAQERVRATWWSWRAARLVDGDGG